MTLRETLAYRPNVGIVLFNGKGEIFMARRADLPGDIWQFPQGGIDEGEEPEQAVWREMKEEIGTNNAAMIGKRDGWFLYDLPDHLIGKALHGKYRGQKQQWFLFRFTGQDSDIKLDTFEEIEFTTWRWVPPEDVLSDKYNLGFKKEVYERLLPDILALYQAASKA